MAPNGAITRGFPGKFNEEHLLEAFTTPWMAQCLKGLQDGKIVVLCVQSGAPASIEAARKGVRDLKRDRRYASTVEIVPLAPGESGEEIVTLRNLNIDPLAEQATTVLLAPPGIVIGRFQGPTDKTALVAMIEKAAAACKPGSGCCPTKKPAGTKKTAKQTQKKPMKSAGVQQ